MRLLSKYSMVISTLVLCGLLFLFFNNLSEEFNEVSYNYAHKKAINLSATTNPRELSDLLYNNKYVANRRDADFIADTLTSRLKRLQYTNLYNLQKRNYGQVPALVAESHSVFTNKLKKSYEKVGLNDTLPKLSELRTKFNLNTAQNKQNCDGTITVQLYSNDKQPLSDAVVRLTEYYFDSLNIAHSNVIAYAKTDPLGTAVFTGLNKNHAFSVLPIKRGFEYGMSKGVKIGKFKKNQTFRFEQLEHRFQMIDNATLKQIKNDGTITVRTPEEYKAEVIKWFVLVLLAWWILVFVLTLRKRKYDPLLIAAAMFLTGLCVIVMYAIQNPLTEDLRGSEMAYGVLLGIGAILLLQFVDFVKLYQSGSKIDFDIPLAVVRWLFLPFKQKVSGLAALLSGHSPWYKKLVAMLMLICCLPFAVFNIPYLSKINRPILRLIERMPKGFGWLLSAIFLTMLLWTPLGREIGGMKVNLNILGQTFQPSEIAKYLIMFFIAAFFTQNADNIIAYSRPDRTRIFSKIKTLGWVISGLIILMLLYASLGDMGPALVIGITFVLLYSLVKSKVNLDSLAEDDRWKRILTCDFAMLVYGVVSFAAFIVIGAILGSTIVFALLWFVVWIMFGILYHKQFFETAFIINLLAFAFIFGGDVATQIPVVRDTDTASRFQQRTDICTNTWGNLDLEHLDANNIPQNPQPVSNTQVANGLWAIATGGMTGQGLGDGNPNLIPAFNTDMILSSIAEIIGWWGLAFIVFVFALLLRRMIVIGYRAGHPFAFYFCVAVAIVTAVQFFVIALGSSGVIPLTGVAVPFLSYGRVSMILNLTALGIVLSFSKNMRQQKLTAAQEQVRQRGVGDYNFPIAIVTWVYVALALLTLGVWQYHALWKQNSTLTRPAFVYSRDGLPIIEYNPRIALITNNMWAGNIYDRNGLLLATSDNGKLDKKADHYMRLCKAGVSDSCITNIASARTKRYYPFGESLFFMVGNQNYGLFFNYDQDNPIGYMAEAQYLSYLRNFDNLHDENGNPTAVVKLKGGENKSGNRYLNTIKKDTVDTLVRFRLRDYHQLVEFMKTGVHGKPLKKHNNDVRNGNFDLKLTVDAALQADMQKRIINHVNTAKDKKGNYFLKNNSLLRISVVIMDAQNGELLTSANYPMPNYQRLREEVVDNRHTYYSDNYLDSAYTDRDLGLTYQTYPGSTAKVMSAMAGFEKMGTSAADKKYFITADEIIETKAKNGKNDEPHGHEVTMREAIVLSSNCYFINLVNDNDLYWNLDSIYETVGAGIGGVVPYFFNYGISGYEQINFREKIRLNQDKALNKYVKRIENGEHDDMNEGEWRWAWGQGYKDFELQASPLNMARVASAVVNGGKMPFTQFVLSPAAFVNNGQVRLLSGSSANILKNYMIAEAANQKDRNGVTFPAFVGGKTGTPERNHYSTKGEKKKDDGWYMFFIDGSATATKRPLAVCVRMERGPGSGAAVKLTKSVVLEALYSKGYITNK